LLFSINNSIQKFKKNSQERKFDIKAKRSREEDSMKGKQFGSLDIVITKRKLHVQAVPVRKRKGCQSKCIGKSISWASMVEKWLQNRKHFPAGSDFLSSARACNSVWL